MLDCSTSEKALGPNSPGAFSPMRSQRPRRKALAYLGDIKWPKTFLPNSATYRFAVQQAITVGPKQLAERRGVTAIRLAFLAVVGLD